MLDRFGSTSSHHTPPAFSPESLRFTYQQSPSYRKTSHYLTITAPVETITKKAIKKMAR